MANWASTSYRIEGNEEDLKVLYNLISDFMEEKRPAMAENASSDWEGNIILALGEEIGESNLRGFFQTIDLSSDGVLEIEAEEAWGATDFRHRLESHFENMKVYFAVEEEGCEVYATNDKEGRYFSCHFRMEICINGRLAYDDFFSEEEALACIAESVGKDKITKEEIEEWNELHDEDADNYILLHEYSLVD